ncbi:MAG: sialate O-acetylesterase [Bacteroidia bacterium]
MKRYNYLYLILIICLPGLSQAKITLPSIFADHMVLQQNAEVPIWGWASPSEEVRVKASWTGEVITTKADNNANWKLTLKTPKAGGPHTITFIGSNTIVLQDILIGEVWLCSGQSNMEWSVNSQIENGEAEALAANHPNIRFFSTMKSAAKYPQDDCHGSWEVCTPASMRAFSAIGYFFGRELSEKLDVPIGLINSSWGGTNIETWIPEELIMENETFAEGASRFTQVPWCPIEPGVTYNTMIAPITPFPIAGTIWYQGESNTKNPFMYDELLPLMVQTWREEWSIDFPFYYVQIAPYKYGRPYEGALVRESQMKSMNMHKSGMVVISDIGNVEDIHPRNKLDVGKRLANWALAKDYGFKDIVYSGPIYREMKKEGKKIRLFFDYAEGGLVCKGEKLTHFQIAGEDKVFKDAEAEIDGNTILVSSKHVKEPVAVRFGFGNTDTPNLFNGAGLPASSFRTDEWGVGME